jgi:hypothetical protein
MQNAENAGTKNGSGIFSQTGTGVATNGVAKNQIHFCFRRRPLPVKTF